MSDKCPRCESPHPSRHPAMQFEGEVQMCPDPWHGPVVDVVADPDDDHTVDAAPADVVPIRTSFAQHPSNATGAVEPAPTPLSGFAGRIAYGQPGNLAANAAEAQEMARLGMNLAVYFGNDSDMVAALMAEAERRAAAWGMRPVQGLQSVWDDVLRRRITP